MQPSSRAISFNKESTIAQGRVAIIRRENSNISRGANSMRTPNLPLGIQQIVSKRTGLIPTHSNIPYCVRSGYCAMTPSIFWITSSTCCGSLTIFPIFFFCFSNLSSLCELFRFVMWNQSIDGFFKTKSFDRHRQQKVGITSIVLRPYVCM